VETNNKSILYYFFYLLDLDFSESYFENFSDDENDWEIDLDAGKMSIRFFRLAIKRRLQTAILYAIQCIAATPF